MKIKNLSYFPVIIMASILLSGCEAIGSIFKAGVWTGTILVVAVIAVVIFIIAKLFRKKRE